METGAELDRINEEFYTGQDLRRYRARGAEERLQKQDRNRNYEDREQTRATRATELERN